MNVLRKKKGLTGIICAAGLLTSAPLLAQSQMGQSLYGESPVDNFGWSVSMKGSRHLAVGAPYNDDNGSSAGQVRVFALEQGLWTQMGQDIDGEYSGDYSGYSVSMGDTATVAIGAYGNDGNGSSAGHVRVYSWSPLDTSWVQKGADIDGEYYSDYSGRAISMSDGQTVAIGAYGNDGNGNSAGHVRVFRWNGSAWVQKGLDIGGSYSYDYAGYSVSMPDSNTVAVGAYGSDYAGTYAGQVKIYKWNGSNWIQKGLAINGEASNDYSGYSVSMADSNTVAIGAPYNDGNGSYSGHVRIYEWKDSVWTQKGTDIDGEAPYDYFGNAVSMGDANTLAVGAYGNDGNGTSSGQVRIYKWNGSNWLQKGVDINGSTSNDYFGYSVSMGDPFTVAGGGYNAENDLATTVGEARVFNVQNLLWSGDFENARGCIDCAHLKVGDEFLSGIDTFLVVDRAMLDSLLTEGFSPQKVCVSLVEDMSYLFAGNTGLNQPLSSWDVSNVTDMSHMFDGASAFDQYINNWDVSAVMDMSHMFEGAVMFNQALSGWDVSNVVNFSSMFKGAHRFNAAIGGWNLGHATHTTSMFEDASLFNQNLGNWDVASVMDMSGMFKEAVSYNSYMANWDVSAVQNMSGMFEGAAVFNQYVGGWDVSSVTDMSTMFMGAVSFDSPLYDWDVSAVTDFSGMFTFAVSFDRGIGSWDVSSVSNMDNMFFYATSFDQDLSMWCVSQVPALPPGFALYSSLSAPNTPQWGTCKLPEVLNNACLSCDMYNVGEWFVHNRDSIYVVDRPQLDSVVAAGLDLSKVCVSHVTDFDSLFAAYPVSGDITQWDVSAVEQMRGTFMNRGTFNQDIGNWDVSSVATFSHAFLNAVQFNQDISGWDISAATDLESMFFFAKDFDQPIGNWDVSSVSNMQSMFFYTLNFDQDLSGWCVKDISQQPYAFSDFSALDVNHHPLWGASCGLNNGAFVTQSGCLKCDSLDVGDVFLFEGDSIEVVDRDRLITLIAAQADLTKVCVSHVTDMKNLFEGEKWFNQDISSWDVSHVTTMRGMFSGATAFNQDISGWDLSSLTETTLMFARASAFNQDLNNWDVSGVTAMSRMFKDAQSFDGNIGDWDVSNVSRMTSMLEGATDFNQDLSLWCVPKFEFLPPPNFALNSALDSAHFPNWGNCPNTYNNVTSLESGAFWNADSCIDCSALNVGDFFSLGDDTLLVVDRPMLDSLIQMRADLTKVCVSHITSLADALRGQYWFNSNISSWDVSRVTDFNNMFRKAMKFNQPLNNWNVSQADNMSRMFFRAESFNQPIANWDVSNATRMNTMFKRALRFNQDISSWDVSAVIGMNDMFRAASTFNQDLSNWCVTNIPTKPTGFDANSALTTAQLPLWGSCGSSSSFTTGLDFSNPNPSDRLSSTLEAPQLYPNPTTGRVYAKGWEGTYEIYSEYGALICTGLIEDGIDLSSYAKGIYIFVITQNDTKTFEKIVKL